MSLCPRFFGRDLRLLSYSIPALWVRPIEAEVEAIQAAMDGQPYARVEDVAEDLDDLWLEIDTLGERLEDLTDSVSFLLMLEDRGLPEWPAN